MPQREDSKIVWACCRRHRQTAYGAASRLVVACKTEPPGGADGHRVESLVVQHEWNGKVISVPQFTQWLPMSVIPGTMVSVPDVIVYRQFVPSVPSPPIAPVAGCINTRRFASRGRLRAGADVAKSANGPPATRTSKPIKMQKFKNPPSSRLLRKLSRAGWPRG